MNFKKNKFTFSTILLTVLFFTQPLNSQVKIGELSDPNEFSLLEIKAKPENLGGLRLPQLTTEERDELLTGSLLTSPEAEGLMIYNITTNCIEFWNSDIWVSLCIPPPAEKWANTPWVGTFHRHNETGERIIYSRHIGAWKAEVVEGDFVILDNGDAGIEERLINMFVNNILDDPEDYQVSGNATSVNGKGNILFRVGLTSKIAIDSKPRYAKIKVSWKEGTSDMVSYMYVRQGETPDNISSVAGSDAKWSPYNLGNYNDRSQYNNGGFVTYPTQAGFIYQWGYGSTAPNHTIPIPYTPQDPRVPSAWSITVDDAIYSLNSACPDGYRLPTGNTNGSSELEFYKQTDVGTGSNIWGYYADGFFDRKAIVSSINGVANNIPNTSVSPGNDYVAYIGMLFYNPTTNASLFLPGAGNRLPGNGALNEAGHSGIYHTNTPSNNTISSYAFNFYKEYLNAGAFQRSYGGSVRCVVETSASVALDVSPDKHTFSYTSGESKSFVVTTNCPSNWTVTDIPSWLTIDSSSGTGDGSFTLTTNDANTGTERSATITITACSESRTVTVTQLPAPDLSGNYTLRGKVCFDVKQENDDDECMPLDSRKDDFEGGSNLSFPYTFSSITASTWDNLTYEILDPNGLVDGYTSSGADNEFLTLTFKSSVSTAAAGKDKENALKVVIIARYSDNTSVEQYVQLELSIQDCSCGCAVRSTLPAGWLTFMCYNVGADPTMSISDFIWS